MKKIFYFGVIIGLLPIFVLFSQQSSRITSISGAGSGGSTTIINGDTLWGTNASDGTITNKSVGVVISGSVTAAQNIVSLGGSFVGNGDQLFGVSGVSLVKESVYASGTAYTLTASDAFFDFGTTDPSVTLGAGTYLLMGRVYCRYNAATFAANQTLTVKLRDATDESDIGNTTTTYTLRVITTITDSIGVITIPPVITEIANAHDIQIFGSLSATPSAGSVTCTEASIIAIKIAP